jgi:hypothetical protein
MNAASCKAVDVRFAKALDGSIDTLNANNPIHASIVRFEDSARHNVSQNLSSSVNNIYTGYISTQLLVAEVFVIDHSLDR